MLLIETNGIPKREMFFSSDNAIAIANTWERYMEYDLDPRYFRAWFKRGMLRTYPQFFEARKTRNTQYNPTIENPKFKLNGYGKTPGSIHMAKIKKMLKRFPKRVLVFVMIL